MCSRSGTQVVASGARTLDSENGGIAGGGPGQMESLREREDLSGLRKRRKWALFACSCLLQFLLQMDMASVAVTLPDIAKDLASSQVLTFSVATAYFLAQTVFQLIFSHMSHGLGRKYVYLSGVSFYIIGAAVAIASHCTRQLVAARTLQGVGAAGMFTMSAIVVVEMMPPRERAAYTAMSQASGALGNICGPLFAALLYGKFTWRSIFVMQLVFAALLLVALALLLPKWRNRQTKLLTTLKQCDWVGILLFMSSSVLILVFISIGGTVQPWTSPVVSSCIAGGGACLISLALHQRYIAKNPAFPKEIFRKPITNIAFGGSLVTGMLLSMVFYNLVLFWGGVRQLSTLMVGLMLLSVTLTYALSAAVVGIAIKTCGRIKWATITGSACAVTGLGLMWFMDETTPVAPLVLISMLAAAGCGMFLPAMISTVLATTEKSWHSHAIAQRTLMFTAGQCIGVSVGLAIFTQVFSNQHVKLVKAEAGNNLTITPQNLLRIIKELGTGSEILGLIVSSLRCVWGTACVTAFVVGTLACVFKCPALPEDDEPDAEETAEASSRVDEESLAGEERRSNSVEGRVSSIDSFKMAVFPRPSSTTSANAPSRERLDTGPIPIPRFSSRSSPGT